MCARLKGLCGQQSQGEEMLPLSHKAVKVKASQGYEEALLEKG